MQSKQAATVVYLQYEALADSSTAESPAAFKDRVGRMLASENWVQVFNALTKLREANKFSPALFAAQILPQFSARVLGEAESLRSYNCKEALTLFQEVARVQPLASLPRDFVEQMIGKCYIRAHFEKSFIREQARQVLKTICERADNPGWVLVPIAKQLLHITSAQREHAGEMLELASRRTGPVQCRKDLGMVLHCVHQGLRSSRLVYKQMKGVLQNLARGPVELGQLIAESQLQEKAKEGLRECWQSKKEAKESKPSLKELIQQRKGQQS